MATPIEGLMKEVLSNLKLMTDVNTVVGECITTSDGTTVIPVSKVDFGFGAGGSEFGAKPQGKSAEGTLFGGGAGGGVSVKPMAFLVIKNDSIRLLPVSDSVSTIDKVVDMVPELFSKLNNFILDLKNKKCESEDE